MEEHEVHQRVKSLTTEIDRILAEGIKDLPQGTKWLVGSRVVNFIWARWYGPVVRTAFDSIAESAAETPALDAAGKEGG